MSRHPTGDAYLVVGEVERLEYGPALLFIQDIDTENNEIRSIPHDVCDGWIGNALVPQLADEIHALPSLTFIVDTPQSACQFVAAEAVAD
jgi:hypothetical protein